MSISLLHKVLISVVKKLHHWVMEACWAHNSDVRVSEPRSATIM